MVGWKNGNRLFKKNNPKDLINYYLPEELINITESILLEYSHTIPPSEGLVYWAGTRQEKEIYITTCIAPRVIANKYNVTVDHYSNFRVVEALSKNRLVHVGQVHTHPTKWVGHSYTDSECASFKISGLLSVVVPSFALKGILPLTECGVHRFDNNIFIRLSNRYIDSHFKITNDTNFSLIDLRNE
jgi:hypothetical protein